MKGKLFLKCTAAVSWSHVKTASGLLSLLVLVVLVARSAVLNDSTIEKMKIKELKQFLASRGESCQGVGSIGSPYGGPSCKCV